MMLHALPLCAIRPSASTEGERTDEGKEEGLEVVVGVEGDAVGSDVMGGGSVEI